MWNPFKKKKRAQLRRRRRVIAPGSGARTLSSIGDLNLSGAVDATFKADIRPISQIIASELAIDRGRMRMMENSNDYATRYLKSLEDNVVGSNGFRFQSKVKRANGKLNKPVNDAVEEWWRTQSKVENYTIEGADSLLDETAADKLILRSIARDGFCLIQMLEGVPNETGFAINILPGEMVDHELIVKDEGRNTITNGVETDRWGRVVAYHIIEDAPEGTRKKHKRLPSDNVICPFLRTHAGQRLGLPWARTTLETLHGLDKFEEAVLTTAREAACKGLFYEQDVENPIGDITEDDLSEDIYPGMHSLLPPGVKAKSYDPSQPTDTYEGYRRGVLMRAAAGLNMSYQSLSSDLSGGNFASQRVGLIDEREGYKSLQIWYATAVKMPIFKAALRVGRLTMADVPLTTDQLCKPSFRGRRWDWVDPEKDLKAAHLALRLGLTTREKLIADTDSDLDEADTMREINRSIELEEENDISFVGELPARPGREPEPDEGKGEEESQEEPENDEQEKEKSNA